MIIVRYFILALLVYLLYYLLLSIFRNRRSQDVTEDGAQAEAVSDVLVEDPICHKLVPRGQALRAKIDGEVVYFCSEECCDLYEKQQEEKV